ncbi:MAG: hypothetical protein D6812_17715 [Deltaproteobacteria bacterium]|nr:MAG: hypothetical protein D6812_17715 [Deltaproteobacteria bacterium]
MCLASVFFAVLVTSVADASVFKKVAFDELVATSSLVVQGKVLDVRSHWDAEGRFIMSSITFEVTERLKGEAPSRITVEEFGGTVDGLTSRPIGFPTFRVGQEAILFLNRWENDATAWRINAYSQGKYNVIRDTKKGTARVVREDVSQDDVILLGDLPEGQDIEEMPLKAFHARIQGRHGLKGNPVK